MRQPGVLETASKLEKKKKTIICHNVDPPSFHIVSMLISIVHRIHAGGNVMRDTKFRS